MDNIEKYTDSILKRILTENTQVPVTSTETSASRSKSAARKRSDKSNPTTPASKSKSTAEEGSVKSSTLSSASGLGSTAEKHYIESDKEYILKYVLPESKSKPATNHLDDSHKASNSLKNGPVKENIKTSSVTCIAPTASTSSYTMNSSYLQSISEGLSRYVSSELDNSQKSPDPYKNLTLPDYMNAFVTGLRSSASTTSKTMYTNSLQSSTEDGFWYVLPENSKKESNSFKNGSVTENTKTSVTGIASSSSSTMPNSSLQSSTMDNSSLQSSTKDLYRYVLPKIKLPSEIKHPINRKKAASNSFKGSATENTEAAVASMAATASSSRYTMDNSSLQSGTKPAISQGSLPKTFKPLILQDNRVKIPDPIRTGSRVENTEVAGTSSGPVATCSKSTFGSSVYMLGVDGKVSVIVTDNNGEPKSQIRFRSDGTPDEMAYPVNLTQFHKPEMAAAIRYAIEMTLWNVGNATTRYHNHIEESRKVEVNINNLKIFALNKLSKVLKGTRNVFDVHKDKLKDLLKVSIDDLTKLEEDIVKIEEVFHCINSDGALLERTLYKMQNAQLSFKESAEAYNASQVMNLWLIRAQKLLLMSAERIENFHSLHNEIRRMFEEM